MCDCLQSAGFGKTVFLGRFVCFECEYVCCVELAASVLCVMCAMVEEVLRFVTRFSSTNSDTDFMQCAAQKVLQACKGYKSTSVCTHILHAKYQSAH